VKGNQPGLGRRDRPACPEAFPQRTRPLTAATAASSGAPFRPHLSRRREVPASQAGVRPGPPHHRPGRQKLRTEVCYGITSLDPARANAACLAGLVRGHWEIENRLHWVGNVTFDEDRSQVRCGNGSQGATLRNLAVSRPRLAGQHNITRGLRWTGRDPAPARPAGRAATAEPAPA
jgi:hypothetical protein